MMKRTHLVFITFVGLSLFASAQANPVKPYVLANASNQTEEQVKKALTSNGFEIAGSYSPYSGSSVIIATNDSLKKAASSSKFGGYGAAVRVSVTSVSGNTQVSYVNPTYMQHAYRMKSDLSGVSASLEKALGKEKTFGSENGLSYDDLKKYRYMFAMPYFDDQIELASFDSYEQAVAKVDAGTSKGSKTKKVYRIDLPGKDETVFGVAIIDGDGSDKTVMSAIDTNEHKHTAHLPYEILVSGKNVYMLHGKFRIAQSFPDLSMGSFMQISSAPDAIEEALKASIQ